MLHRKNNKVNLWEENQSQQVLELLDLHWDRELYYQKEQAGAYEAGGECSCVRTGGKPTPPTTREKTEQAAQQRAQIRVSDWFSFSVTPLIKVS